MRTLSGIIVLNKPVGCSSHKMVSLLRRLLHMKKIGHGGTLDPDAGGVLPMLVGTATRAADFLIAQDKRYRAVIRLGVTTDTLDKGGNVLSERAVNVSKDDILKLLPRFTGEIRQTAPMYSAVSVGGQRLYRLARKGIEIERPVRAVTVFDIQLIDFSAPFLTLDVYCSKGTYIRSLAADIGEALGCGGSIDALTRTQSGRFDLEDAITPEALEKMVLAGEFDRFLRPLDGFFENLDKIALTEKQSGRVKNGVPIYYDEKETGQRLRVYDSDGNFIALSEIAEMDGRKCLRLVKGFY